MNKNIFRLFLVIAIAIGIASCNDKWKIEQFEQMASFKAEQNDQGVTWAYLRYNPAGKVRYELPVIISGSTPNSKKTDHPYRIRSGYLSYLKPRTIRRSSRALFQAIRSKILQHAGNH